MSNLVSSCRRNFLRNFGGLTVGLAVSSSAFAKLSAAPVERHLQFYNLHTGESLNTTFCVDGVFVEDSLRDINTLLRDHRTGEVCVMDPQLLILLDDLKTLMGNKQPFHIVSGYRSPATNNMLSAQSNGVAKKSLHMQGKAIDVRVPGVDVRALQKSALALKGGGVGLYTRSDFVHLDVGRVRYWGS
ncbi:exported protein [gamma proteobacterium IMCC2047]|nr:exported protein [gamma proteobacterium IMCC2047]